MSEENPLGTTSKTALRVAALVGFLAVALGAFGAHALREILARHQTEEIWRTAVLYHLVHSVMLVTLAWHRPWRRGPWNCFLIGIVIFSGSLYFLAGLNVRWLGAITPIGGLFLLAGWFWLCVSPTGAAENIRGNSHQTFPGPPEP